MTHQVSGDRDVHTRGIDVAAPVTAVWPWIAQFGLGKAGFYSYELFERIIGIPVTNVESIEPTMQSLTVGAEVLLHPKAPGISVGLLEQGSYVCFGERPRGEQSGDSGKSARPHPGRSWGIYISPLAENSCRLVSRNCIERSGKTSLSKRIAGAIEESIDFVMEQRMLRTIKRLAESSTARQDSVSRHPENQGSSR